MTNPHNGSSLDDFLHESGIYEEATSVALARVLAWQIRQRMDEEGLTNQAMADRMGTSRSQLDRLLRPMSGGVTLETLHRAARAVNRELQISLV
ncbi:MAG: XRE family transcriptional regulator [Thermomicrobiales bacterium]|nr:XRE family transcriptional regulator [Thermomicrobiales bacterium]